MSGRKLAGEIMGFDQTCSSSGLFIGILCKILQDPKIIADNPGVVIDAIKARIRNPGSATKNNIPGIHQADSVVVKVREMLEKLNSSKSKTIPVLYALREASSIANLFDAARRIVNGDSPRRDPRSLHVALCSAVNRIPSATFMQEPIISAKQALDKRMVHSQ